LFYPPKKILKHSLYHTENHYLGTQLLKHFKVIKDEDNNKAAPLDKTLKTIRNASLIDSDFFTRKHLKQTLDAGGSTLYPTPE